MPDIHLPYHDKKALQKVFELIKLHKPTHVIQLGDALDQYVFSKYSRSLKISPTTEILEGIQLLEDFWKEIKSIVPKAKCFQLMGNHDVRISKRIGEKLPELSEFFSHRDFYRLEGVQVMDSDRDYLELFGVVYVHGWLSKSLDHAKYFGRPTVHGHRHRPTIEYDHEKLWSMDCGYIADKNQMPLQYTMSKMSKWTMTCGIVQNGEPRLIKL